MSERRDNKEGARCSYVMNGGDGEERSEAVSSCL